MYFIKLYFNCLIHKLIFDNFSAAACAYRGSEQQYMAREFDHFFILGVNNAFWSSVFRVWQ